MLRGVFIVFRLEVADLNDLGECDGAKASDHTSPVTNVTETV